MARKGKGRKWITIIALVFFFAVVVVMFATSGRSILKEIRGLNVWYLLLSAVCYAGSFLTWSIKYYILVLRRVPKARFPFVALANLAGNFINVTTPSGRMAGEPLKARAIAKRYGARFSTVFAASMLDKMTLTVSMLLLLLPLSVYSFLEFDMPKLVELLLVIFVLFWLAVGAASYIILKRMSESRSLKLGSAVHRITRFFLRGRFKDRRYFVKRFRGGIMEFRSSFKTLLKNPVFMVIDILLGTLSYIFRFATAYMLFISAGYSVDILTVSTVVIIAFIIGLTSQFPGMVGIAESTMTGLYFAMGVRPYTALTVSILTQMNSYILELGIGYLALAGINIMTGVKVKKSDMERVGEE